MSVRRAHRGVAPRHVQRHAQVGTHAHGARYLLRHAQRGGVPDIASLQRERAVRAVLAPQSRIRSASPCASGQKNPQNCLCPNSFFTRCYIKAYEGLKGVLTKGKRYKAIVRTKVERLVYTVES